MASDNQRLNCILVGHFGRSSRMEFAQLGGHMSRKDLGHICCTQCAKQLGNEHCDCGQFRSSTSGRLANVDQHVPVSSQKRATSSFHSRGKSTALERHRHRTRTNESGSPRAGSFLDHFATVTSQPPIEKREQAKTIGSPPALLLSQLGVDSCLTRRLQTVHVRSPG